VDGEEPTGLQRLLTVADSGNGVSGRLDPREWLFINPELTVHLHREPGGEWIGLDANTVIGPAGVGTAFSVLHDCSGPVGRGAQALMIRPVRAV
jgi:Thioesterase-like superfamily